MLRIVRAARRDASYEAANTFWEVAGLGPAYSAIWALHLFVTGLYYIKGVSALRRLSSSKYHAHPEELRRIERRVNNREAQLGTLMMPI